MALAFGITMISPRRRGLLAVTLLVTIGLLLIAVVPIKAAGTSLAYVTIGLIFGTLFGNATLAAAWTAFGPLALRSRLPLSLAWLVTSQIALVMNMAIHEPKMDASFLVVFGGCLFGQWAATLVSLSGLALGLGLRFRYLNEPTFEVDRRQKQFGIRQLMIVTPNLTPDSLRLPPFEGKAEVIRRFS